MTPFSSALEFYMREKDIKTYSIAQFCGIDRSNMYKMINGKRNPSSEEFVGRIAEFMRLNPMERNHLMETYRITIMGYDTYYRRKSVQDFLLSFSENNAEPDQRFFSQEYLTMNVDEWELKLQQGIIVTDKQLTNLIYSIINIELQKTDGKISLVMQPENKSILDILIAAGAKRKNLDIEHIFCLSNTNDIVSDKQDYNLICLKNILPMFVQCICNYMPYCYYDNIVSHNNRFNLLSSMILTSEYAVIFSMEENYGMLLSAKRTIQYLHRQFQSLKSDAFPMAKKMNSLEKQLKSFENINFNDRGMSFQPEGCLIPIIPTAFLEKYMNRSLLEDQQMRGRVFHYVSHAAQTLNTIKATFLFTEEGIKHFISSGRISELPESVYYSLEYNDRLVLLRRLIKECERGRYQMLRADAPIVLINICLYSAVQEGYMLLPSAQGDRIFLELQESGLLYAFRDYLEDVSKNYVYTEEETIIILKSLVEKR